MAIIKDRQSITDIAVQYAGDAAMAPAIAKLNGLSVTSKVEPGTELKVQSIANNEVVIYLQINLQSPAMRIETSARPGGIGYMEIGTDFIVN